MTKQEQIEILERAIPLIGYSNGGLHRGVCYAIGVNLPERDYVLYYDPNTVSHFLNEAGIVLPIRFIPDTTIVSDWSWPLTHEGDEARRQFLRDHIDRLRKELTTP